jgi:hypothetical protein
MGAMPLRLRALRLDRSAPQKPLRLPPSMDSARINEVGTAAHLYRGRNGDAAALENI